MRILFAATHVGYLRNFESTLALLAERGHQVHIVTDRRKVADAIDGMPIMDRLTAKSPGAFTIEALQFSKRHVWYGFATAVREGRNYWRYLDPAFDQSPKLRARGRQNAPRAVVWLGDLPLLRSRAGARVLTRLFRSIERLIPSRREVEALFDRVRPDLLFVTPLLYFGSQQVDYVRSARRRGIPSVLGVGSWDHLTTKGMIHEMPDRLLVWNELQRDEAVALHDARPDQVEVTGAQAYDHWFTTEPSTTQEAFCARVGLWPDRPYLLYLCSSPFIAPHEVDVVRQWMAAIRASGDPVLRTVGLLVRPHPQNAAQWAEVELGTDSGAAIWPRGGANPIGLDARREYYDSMYHAHAVVGVNTSALIESGIVGRPVYSVMVPEFSGTQEGTLHFRHLRRGGLLSLAETPDEHVAQLARSFASAGEDRERVREFIRSFVRPHGLGEAATPHVVAAVEAAAADAPEPRRLALAQRVLHGGLVVAMGLVALARFGRRAEREKAVARLRKRAWLAWRHAIQPPRRAVRRTCSAVKSILARARFGRRAEREKAAARLRKRAWSAWRHAIRPPRRAVRRTRSAVKSILARR